MAANSPYQYQPMQAPLQGGAGTTNYGIADAFLPGLAGGAAMAGENVQGITYMDIERAARELNISFDEAFKRLTAPHNISGTKTTPAMTKSEVKQASKRPALLKYAQEVLGLDAKQASDWTNKQMKGSRPLKDIGKNRDVSFLDFVQSGAAEGLAIGAKGGIRGIPREETGTGRRDPLEEQQIGLSQEIFGAAGGLPGMYGEDARAGLNFRNQVRDLLSSQYGTNIDDVLNADVQRIKDISRDLTQHSMGELLDSGFMSSSLVGRKLDRDVGQSQRKMATDLQGKLAELRRGEIQNILGAAQVLGGPQTFGQYMGGSLQAPGAYGGIDDATAMQLIHGKQKAGAALETERGKALAGIYTTPYYGAGAGAGGSGGGGGFLSGALGGAAAGAAGGPVGMGIGAVLGGIGGLF